MHPNCNMLAQHFAQNYFSEPAGKKILEVGSTDINGGIRHFFPGSEYLGIDVVPYAGVDLVLKPEEIYAWPLADASFDLVISTNCLEHCTRPWLTLKEMARVAKPGALICNIVPWRIHVHKEGVPAQDCWRILSDGMRVIMEDAGLEVLECREHEDDTIGIGRKPA